MNTIMTATDFLVVHGETQYESASGGLKGAKLRLRIGSRFIGSLVWVIALVMVESLCWASGLHTNPLSSDPLVREAFEHFYHLDFQGEVERFERLHAAHQGDPQGTAFLLEAVVLEELYRLDLLDTTFYANDGFLSGKHPTAEDPKARDRIFALTDEAVQEADWRIAKNPKDVDALYARAWARALKSIYVGMAEKSYVACFRLAAKAKDDDVRVLQLDPEYVDAKLVVGIYEYVVGSLSFPFRVLIGFAGITGSKTKGMEMLHEAGSRGILSRVEAQTALALFLRREAKYQQAILIVGKLKDQYPHNYLFCLEEANLRKDAGEGMGAVAAYREVLSADAKPGYFSSVRLELTYFGLGEALRGQRHYPEAAHAYERAAESKNVGPELKVRSLVAAGECHDMNEDRQDAVKDYSAAIGVGSGGSRTNLARKHLRSPYRGS
jgi:hypothetical protein